MRSFFTLDLTSVARWFFFLMCGLFVLLYSRGLIFCPYVLMSFVRSLSRGFLLCFCCDCPCLPSCTLSSHHFIHPCSLFTCCAYLHGPVKRTSHFIFIHSSSFTLSSHDQLPSSLILIHHHHHIFIFVPNAVEGKARMFIFYSFYIC
jgi:hypothetical protein